MRTDVHMIVNIQIMVLWDVTHVAWYKDISFSNKSAAFNFTAEEMKSETAGSFKKFVTIYQATRCHFTENCHLNI
jgi:hypothetical protein